MQRPAAYNGRLFGFRQAGPHGPAWGALQAAARCGGFLMGLAGAGQAGAKALAGAAEVSLGEGRFVLAAVGRCR